jgi:hypothetical protein
MMSNLRFTEQEYADFMRQRESEEAPVKPSRKRGKSPPMVTGSIPATEGDLKRTVSDYLDLMQNQHRLYYDRLNSGELITLAGESRRRIVLCRPGTADFFILMNGRLIFIELKSPTGEQRKDQKYFEALVTWHGAEYYIVRSLDELLNIVERRE